MWKSSQTPPNPDEASAYQTGCRNGSLVQPVARLPYQRQGDGGDVLSASFSATILRSIDSSPFRQQRSNLLSEQRGISQKIVSIYISHSRREIDRDRRL